MVRTRNLVSLFGIPLAIDTAPFVEKDKIVARCATSAIWSFLSAQNGVGDNPSLSSITKSAGTIAEGGRTFPSESLTDQQICRSLRSFGFESDAHHLTEDNSVRDTKELSYAYISNGIPVLLGGMVYQVVEGEVVEKGPHLVCALGYRLGSITSAEEDMGLTSHSVDRVYVHDDRYGPYVSWQEASFSFNDKVSGETRDIHGWEYGLKNINDEIVNESREYFSTDIVICGVNHKIRIQYSEVYDSCLAFFAYIQQDMQIHVSLDNAQSRQDAASIKAAIDCRVAISLIRSTDYKESVRKDKEFLFFNGTPDRNVLLLKSLPKHLWLCRLEDDDGAFLDFIFDATEVPQGNTLVGFVTYKTTADTVMRLTEAFVRERVWRKYEFTDDSKINIRPFVSFFEAIPDRQRLNIKYGPLRTPSRALKVAEIDETRNVSQADTRTISAHAGSLVVDEDFDRLLKYIWVIDISGNLVIGVEDPMEVQGHPTLIDGRPARIGGQLHFDKKTETWEVDLFSAAYSSHLEQPSDQSIGYLENVKEKFFADLNVTCNYGSVDHVAAE